MVAAVVALGAVSVLCITLLGLLVLCEQDLKEMKRQRNECRLWLAASEAAVAKLMRTNPAPPQVPGSAPNSPSAADAPGSLPRGRMRFRDMKKQFEREHNSRQKVRDALTEAALRGQKHPLAAKGEADEPKP